LLANAQNKWLAEEDPAGRWRKLADAREARLPAIAACSWSPATTITMTTSRVSSLTSGKIEFFCLEENMFKPVVVAAAALAIGSTSIVYAQQRSGGPGGCGDDGPRFEQRHRPGLEDMGAFTDAGIAGLKAGLELTPDQAKHWPAFEQALRDVAQLRIQRQQARDAGNQQGRIPNTPFERLARRADNMSRMSAALKHVADADAPLYQSLNDAQKNRFTKLARFLRSYHHHHMHAFNEGGGGAGSTKPRRAPIERG
jgi:hypothetical protein